jgi:ribosomal protein L11 methyltransferase
VGRENARANGVAPLLEIVHAAGIAERRLSAGRYDLILANILLEPLRHLATPMARLAASRARVVLSGLLLAHGRAALASYRARGFALERRLALDGWLTLVLKRR